jgi:hypothetical protein
MRDDAGRLKDIFDAIDKIEAHSGGGRAEFETNELLQVWAVTTCRSLARPPASSPLISG